MPRASVLINKKENRRSCQTHAFQHLAVVRQSLTKGKEGRDNYTRTSPSPMQQLMTRIKE